VAERNPAVHAAAGLLGDLAGPLMGILLLIDLSPVADPFVDGPFGGVDLCDFEKPMWISHG
jgi:hypothetical protein